MILTWLNLNPNLISVLSVLLTVQFFERCEDFRVVPTLNVHPV